MHEQQRLPTSLKTYIATVRVNAYNDDTTAMTTIPAPSAADAYMMLMHLYGCGNVINIERSIAEPLKTSGNSGQRIFPDQTSVHQAARKNIVLKPSLAFVRHVCRSARSVRWGQGPSPSPLVFLFSLLFLSPAPPCKRQGNERVHHDHGHHKRLVPLRTRMVFACLKIGHHTLGTFVGLRTLIANDAASTIRGGFFLLIAFAVLQQLVGALVQIFFTLKRMVKRINVRVVAQIGDEIGRQAGEQHNHQALLLLRRQGHD